MTSKEQDPGSHGTYNQTDLTHQALINSRFYERLGCSDWEQADLADDYYGHIDVWLTSRTTRARVGTSLRWQHEYSDMGTLTVRQTEYEAWQAGNLGCVYWIHCYGLDENTDTPLTVYGAKTEDLMPQLLPNRWFYSAPAQRAKARKYRWTGQHWIAG